MIRLYVVVRNEMSSMTTGRIAAQVSHASTQMMNTIQKHGTDSHKALLEEWLAEANGFGTTIVLQPNAEKKQDIEIINLTKLARNIDIASELVIDPEYYIMDGNVPIRQENILTCAYFFGNVDSISNILGNLNLL